jgi:hypothetical protein
VSDEDLRRRETASKVVRGVHEIRDVRAEFGVVEVAA